MSLLPGRDLRLESDTGSHAPPAAFSHAGAHEKDGRSIIRVLASISTVIGVGLLVGVVVLAVSRSALVAVWLEDTVDPENGQITLAGVRDDVTIRRDALGIPVIEAKNSDDVPFAMGYAMAQDRLEQMVGLTLTAQGRLAELAGPAVLDLDVYFRTLGVRRYSERQYGRLGDASRHGLERFSQGVNAYLESHRDRLPMGFRVSGYQPEPWTPVNSIDLVALMNLTVALNLQEEVNILNIVNTVGWQNAAWLVPVYPDAPLPFQEAEKLSALDLTSMASDLSALSRAYAKIEKRAPAVGVPTSNNWAIGKARSRQGASILANDAHLMLTHPPLWLLMHVKCPEYDMAGLALAGLPAILFGYNGRVAWGATAVMADTQDLFIEQLRSIDGKHHYRYKERWYPVEERTEEFKILGGKPVTSVVRWTRHGPLISDALRSPPVNPIKPPRFTGHGDGSYALAVSWETSEPADSMDVLFEFGRSKSADEAAAHAKRIGFIHLNLVFADRDNIGWQVTGRYPMRKAGKGLFPSPGWTGHYDWDGFVPSDLLPHARNPAQGFLATANQRIIPQESPLVLSNSWFYPERAERIAELIEGTDRHDADTSVMMQADRFDRFSQKLKEVLRRHQGALAQAVGRLPERERGDAERSLAMLLAFDGRLTERSRNGAMYGIFLDMLTREAFLDEFAAEPGYLALVNMSVLGYSAQQDHALQREDSPFWDDVTTPDRIETKWDIMSRALSRSWRFAEGTLGADSSQWQWGALHAYTWESPATQMKPYLGTIEQWAITALTEFLDRGPYPAGGNHNTLNQASYHIGHDFKVWMIPVTRMIVDFGRSEPMFLVNSGGQSGNPASRHYDDGIELWLSWKNRPVPFQQKAIDEQYRNVFRLHPAAKPPPFQESAVLGTQPNQ